jgi:hypothetical protein
MKRFTVSAQYAADAKANAATMPTAKVTLTNFNFQVIPNSPLGFTNYYQTQRRVCTGAIEIDCSYGANNR